MTTTDPLAAFGTKKTHQQNQVPGRPEQVKNNAGGFVFQIDEMAQLRRFLTMGTTGGTFYVGQDELTRENGQLIIDLLTKPQYASERLKNHKAVVDEILEISLGGRAMKQNPTLFALAIACQLGDTDGKQYARKKITEVVRTGTHLFIFAGYLKQFGGWSRGLRREVGKWYTEKDADQLAYQLIKYRSRVGYTHRDILRLTHPKVEGPASRSAIEFAIKGDDIEGDHPEMPVKIEAFKAAQVPGASILGVLDKVDLPWEALPDSAMNDPQVWAKMLDHGMPIRALVRQLPRLTNLGLINQMGGTHTDKVIRQLLDPVAVSKSKIHPFNVLVALKTYKQGHGMRSTWTPNVKIIDALDEMFYMAFANVEPTGKRTMNALDVSGSMGWSAAGQLPMTAREVSAALAMTTIRTEPNAMTVGFTGGHGYSRYGSSLTNRFRDQGSDDSLTVLPVSARQRLDDVINAISDLPFGSTDCSLPMVYAQKNQLAIDTFVIYTDNETWTGGIHPFQALKEYRKASGLDSRLVVVACTPTKFSIADPSDAGMMDISGFDSNVPQLISDFSAGRV
jgi:60 kDa SS-A/Ro ribonucleoprotein